MCEDVKDSGAGYGYGGGIHGHGGVAWTRLQNLGGGAASEYAGEVCAPSTTARDPSPLHRSRSLPYLFAHALRFGSTTEVYCLTLQGVADSWLLPLCRQTDLTVRENCGLRTSIAC